MHVETYTIGGDGDVIWLNETNREVQLLWAHFNYSSSATVGSRRMSMILIAPDTSEVTMCHAGVVQAASQSAVHYRFVPGTFRETALIDNAVEVPFPMQFFIPKDYTLKFGDKTAIDIAGDTSILNFQIKRT